MNISKLLHVLVVGGAVAACDHQSSEMPLIERNADRTADAAYTTDAALGKPADAALGKPADAAFGKPVDAGIGETADADRVGSPGDTWCFCDSEACCDRTNPDSPERQEGFYCCWATMC